MYSLETVYEIVVFSIGDTKSGTKMGKLQLKDPNDESVMNCILWEETLNRLDNKLFRTGNLVKIVSATYNEKFNNCLISALELVKEAKLGIDKAEQDAIYNEILGYINKFKNEKLKTFMLDFFKENEEKIKLTPAAKRFHHNYLGGLLVHTLECLKFAEVSLHFFQSKLTQRVYTQRVFYTISERFLNT